MTGLGYYHSPAGILQIRSEGAAITEILRVDEATQTPLPTPVIDQCINELDEYFNKGRKFFTVELDPKGTDFQKRVWNELQTIPFGNILSYEALAIRLGDIKAIRAVASANGSNPIMIIIPCHRVIGKNGELTGYAGGLDAKEWLLYHEGSRLKQLNLF
jgi:methylated-DNA-[protein]-cysteine S-methyltransferase